MGRKATKAAKATRSPRGKRKQKEVKPDEATGCGEFRIVKQPDGSFRQERITA